MGTRGTVRITLSEWRGQWIATDEERDISSSPMPTREAALEDLDEVVALADEDLDLSEATERDIQATEGELERDETVSHEELKREFE
jgi:hypothetical protein